MNPVSFYFCHAQDKGLVALIAEVRNTPWNERHLYVIDCREPAEQQVIVRNQAKVFHVSPFMPLNQTYHWRIQAPAAEVNLQIESFEHDERRFAANLCLQRREFQRGLGLRMLVSYSF